MSKLVKYDPAQVMSFLEGLKVGVNDVAKLRIKGGMISGSVKRATGVTNTATIMLDGRFKALTKFDANGATVAERREAVIELYKAGHRQTTIADMLGVSQATVSNDLRKAST